MPEDQRPRRRHLLPTNTSQPQRFTAPSGGGGAGIPIPDRDRRAHAEALSRDIERLRQAAIPVLEQQGEIGLEAGLGLQIEFVGYPGVELAFESLGNERARDPGKHVEVLSVLQRGDVTTANVFVPEGNFAQFEKYLADYLAEKRDKNGDPIDHKNLVNAISSIRAAGLRALWADEMPFPEDEQATVMWEVWLPVRGRRELVLNDFRRLANLAGCEVSEHHVSFPERTVVLLRGSPAQFTQSSMLLNCVAELRYAKETAAFFDGLPAEEQWHWAEELLERLEVPPPDSAVPHVCILDSGTNRGNPLLAPLLADVDLHTVKPAWGVDDQQNHGTGMAGLAAFGDLVDSLDTTEEIALPHRLESVKLVNMNGGNDGDSEHHGYLFSEAISRPEIASPQRKRVFVSAVTSADGRDAGRPSAWSATVDRLAADYDGDGQFPRLIVLAAGNTLDPNAWFAYPGSLSGRNSQIRDPSQAWNALTVGAYTSKTNITEEDATAYQPVAPDGGLSPYTSTSAMWDNVWPMKPDVVFEGGNVGKDTLGAAWMMSLQLLTTHHAPQERLLTHFNATSAASAGAAKFAAHVMAAYPELKAETIRALVVHSAHWTDAMRQEYAPGANPTKEQVVRLIRHCGWGVPDMERALWSANNALTLVVEDQVFPFHKVKGRGVVTRDMNLHALPWPKEALEALGETEVELRITLSYFIEPNPSARGVASKFYYPSHRLRFDVQRPTESLQDFRRRINAAAEREDDGDPINPRDPNWVLGDRKRHRGSLHQDVWKGTAAALASREHIAVYPTNGWWRTRPRLERFDQPAKYSLVVSIRTPSVDADIYTPVEQRIAARVAAVVGT